MKLTHAQLLTLRQLVLELLPEVSELRGFLDTELEIKLDRYALGDNLTDIVWGLLQAAGKENPPFLGRFVEKFGQTFGHDDNVKAFLAQIAAPARRDERVVAPPYYACFVGSRPFVDREQLRPTLERLHAPPPTALKRPRILVVTGDPSSGKTHTKFLINHLGESYGFQPAIVDCSRFPVELTPEDLGRRIATRLGLAGMPEPGNEQLSRWLIAFFDWFVAAAAGEERWVVIDFGRISISTAVSEFLDELATHVSDSLPRMRIVLLGYRKKLTASVRRIVEQDDTKAITASELSMFFAQFYREYGPQLDEEELTTRIAEHVPEVLAKMAETDADDRYVVMEDALTEICERIGKEA